MKKNSLMLVPGTIVLYLAIASTSVCSEPIYTLQDIKILLSRAQQGDTVSQYHLGYAYAHGEIVVKDDREAMRWYRKAAEGGHAEAARQLQAIEDRLFISTDRPAVSISVEEAADMPIEPQNAASIFEKVWQSVVVVSNGDMQGSGVVIQANIVATNCHVVDQNSPIFVHKFVTARTDENTAFYATMHYTDQGRDFCLLNVDGLQGVPVTVRRYNTIRVGEKVYALGAPFGYELSISAGIVSQLRAIDNYRQIQTDAAVSPGSSGGGLFDGAGSLIGIMTSKIADESVEGIGFAIPADLVFR